MPEETRKQCSCDKCDSENCSVLEDETLEEDDFVLENAERKAKRRKTRKSRKKENKRIKNNLDVAFKSAKKRTESDMKNPCVECVTLENGNMLCTYGSKTARYNQLCKEAEKRKIIPEDELQKYKK